MKRDKIEFGSETIDYTIHFSDRKTLGITIRPEMEVWSKPLQIHLIDCSIQSQKKSSLDTQTKGFVFGLSPQNTKTEIY